MREYKKTHQLIRCCISCTTNLYHQNESMYAYAVHLSLVQDTFIVVSVNLFIIRFKLNSFFFLFQMSYQFFFVSYSEYE